MPAYTDESTVLTWNIHCRHRRSANLNETAHVIVNWIRVRVLLSLARIVCMLFDYLRNPDQTRLQQLLLRAPQDYGVPTVAQETFLVAL